MLSFLGEEQGFSFCQKRNCNQKCSDIFGLTEDVYTCYYIQLRYQAPSSSASSSWILMFLSLFILPKPQTFALVAVGEGFAPARKPRVIMGGRESSRFKEAVFGLWFVYGGFVAVFGSENFW